MYQLQQIYTSAVDSECFNLRIVNPLNKKRFLYNSMFNYQLPRQSCPCKIQNKSRVNFFIERKLSASKSPVKISPAVLEIILNKCYYSYALLSVWQKKSCLKNGFSVSKPIKLIQPFKRLDRTNQKIETKKHKLLLFFFN